MVRLLLFCFFVALLALSGCAGKKMSYEESKAYSKKVREASVQVFENVTEAEVLEASEKALFLIDPTDARITSTDHSLMMSRYYTAFFVFSAVHGFDYWMVKTNSRSDNAVEATVVVSTAQNQGTFASIPVQPFPSHIGVEQTNLSEAEAKLFFYRVAYFLGQQPSWITCKEAADFSRSNGYSPNAMTKIGESGGQFPFLCGDNWFGVEDKGPDALSSWRQ